MSRFGKNTELTKGAFISHMEAYIKRLLSDLKAQPDDFLKEHGIDGQKALSLLLKRTDENDENSAVLKRVERIVPEKLEPGDTRKPKDKFHVKYTIVRKDYWKKMAAIYDELEKREKLNENEGDYSPSVFSNEDDMIDEILSMDDGKAYSERGGLKKINEDGEGGGATSCGSAMQGGGSNPDAGQYVTPLFGKPMKRKTLYINEDQARYIQEDYQLDEDYGDFAYDVPFPGDKETNDHQNMMKKSFSGYKKENVNY